MSTTVQLTTSVTAASGQINRTFEATWSDAWSASTGNGKNNGTNVKLFANKEGDNTYSIARAFFNFDLSSIPQAVEINSVTLTLIWTGEASAADGDVMTVVASNQVDTSNLQLDDYNNLTLGTAYSDNQLILPGENKTMTFNSTGLSDLNSAHDSGSLFLCGVALGSDQNNSPGTGTNDFSYNSNTSYLEITYTRIGSQAYIIL